MANHSPAREEEEVRVETTPEAKLYWRDAPCLIGLPTTRTGMIKAAVQDLRKRSRIFGIDLSAYDANVPEQVVPVIAALRAHWLCHSRNRRPH